MNWDTFKPLIEQAAKAALDSGWITQKAYDAIMSALESGKLDSGEFGIADKIAIARSLRTLVLIAGEHKLITEQARNAAITKLLP